MTRIFYAGDIHGSELCFKKFINAAQFYNADVLILGGDLTAKMVIPVVELGGGRFEANLFNRTEVAETPEELEALKNRINSNGFYAYPCEPAELEEIKNSGRKQEDLFNRLILESLRRWVKIGEDRLRDRRVQCYVMPGNDDDPAVSDVLERSSIIVNPEFQKVELPGEYEMISVGFSNKTPFDSPREMEEDQLHQHIMELAEQISNTNKAIFNLHCPPYDSGLDLAPEVTPDLRLVTRGGQPVMEPVGSKAVRSVIERFQPMIGLHGHVHESRGTTKIGKTLCLNPGSDYAAGVLRGVLVNLDGEKVKGYQFVSG